MRHPSIASMTVYCGILFLTLAAGSSAALGDSATFFKADFDSGVPSEFSGITVTTGVQGWGGLGHGDNVFSGQMLHNDTGPYGGTQPQATRLTLTGLPPHESIDLQFLLAIIDTWDGSTGGSEPDYFTVTVDGQIVFSETFTNFPDTHTATYPNSSTPPEVILALYIELGFLGLYPDSAFDLGLEPALQGIPHTAGTVVIEWIAGGSGWQGSGDESWAIDNVRIGISSPTPIQAESWGRVKLLYQ